MDRKDFGGWHVRKLQLELRKAVPYFREREIWWAAIGHNVGNEEDGKGEKFARPVIIIRKFNETFFYGLPLSTTSKQGKYYFSLTTSSRKNTALLSQLRAFDAKRLLNKMDVLELDMFLKLTYELKAIIFYDS